MKGTAVLALLEVLSLLYQLNQLAVQSTAVGACVYRQTLASDTATADKCWPRTLPQRGPAARNVVHNVAPFARNSLQKSLNVRT